MHLALMHVNAKKPIHSYTWDIKDNDKKHTLFRHIFLST